MRAVLAVFVSLLAGSTAAILYLDLGASCGRAGGVQRVCKRLADCPAAQVGIQRRHFPDICTFIGEDPVVCCSGSAPTTAFAAPTSQSKGVGEVCQERGGERWYCRRHDDCPGADRIQQGWNPDICSFQKREPVICCPPYQGSQSQSRPPTTVATRPPSWPSWTRPPNEDRQTFRPTDRPPSNNRETQRPGGDRPSWNRPEQTTARPPEERPPIWGQPDKPVSKAEEKCKIYGRYVYKNVTPPILLPGTVAKEEAFCGRLATPLIVNGVDAGPREFPHMARIGYGNEPRIDWLCGGSLISERYILSAAHCTRPAGRLASWANLGDLDTSKSDDDAQPITIKIIQRIDHPDYQPRGALYHDISLYKLQRDAPLGIYIRPICLNTKNILPDTVAIASGWGHTMWRDPGGGSPMLQKADLKFVPPSKCNNSYRSESPNQLPVGISSDYMLCAGGHDGKDTCQGDSGGPLQVARREPYCTYSIVGVTSFGKGCGSSTPGVYTNVAHYVPWIESIVWPT